MDRWLTRQDLCFQHVTAHQGQRTELRHTRENERHGNSDPRRSRGCVLLDSPTTMWNSTLYKYSYVGPIVSQPDEH